MEHDDITTSDYTPPDFIKTTPEQTTIVDSVKFDLRPIIDLLTNIERNQRTQLKASVQGMSEFNTVTLTTCTDPDCKQPKPHIHNGEAVIMTSRPELRVPKGDAKPIDFSHAVHVKDVTPECKMHVVKPGQVLSISKADLVTVVGGGPDGDTVVNAYTIKSS